jgi:hypothetical protein
MAGIAAMRGQLVRIRQEIIGSPVFTTGRPDDDAKVIEEAKRLERLAQSVALILRELKSAESLVHLRQQHIHKVHQDQRYSAQQSLKQQATSKWCEMKPRL